MIIIKKINCDVSSVESESVEKLINQFNDNKLTDFPGETLHLKFVENIEFERSKSIAIIVTEYWAQGLDEGSYATDSMEEILEGYRSVVEEVIDF